MCHHSTYISRVWCIAGRSGHPFRDAIHRNNRLQASRCRCCRRGIGITRYRAWHRSLLVAVGSMSILWWDGQIRADCFSWVSACYQSQKDCNWAIRPFCRDKPLPACGQNSCRMPGSGCRKWCFLCGRNIYGWAFRAAAV